MSNTAFSTMQVSIDDIPINIAVYRYVDDDFIFIDFNNMAEKTENISREEIIGKCITKVFPGVKKLGLFNLLLRINKNGGYEELDLGFYEDDRISGWRHNSVKRLPNGDVIVFYTDITKQKHLEEERLKQKNQFEEAQKLAHLGSWEWDIQTNEIKWSDEVFRIFGEEPQSFTPTYDYFLSYLCEEGKAALTKAVMNAINHKEAYLFEHNIYRKDGTIRYVQESGNAHFDDQGEATSMIGTVLDITERKEAENQLQSLGHILDNSMNEVYMFDTKNMHFTYVNKEAQKNTGYTFEEMMNMTPLDLKPEYSMRSFLLLLKPLLDGSKKELVFETIHHRKNGQTYNVEIRLKVMEFNSTRQFVVIAHDISDRKLAQHQLQESEKKFRKLATIDNLTGILNRHKSNEELDIEINRDRRYNDVFSLAMFDIDHFKTINDTYGHNVGDYVLKEFSTLISKHIRESDRLGRWGGEEFILLLPHLNKKDAMSIAEKLRKIVANHSFKDIPQITTSVGVTTYAPDDTKEHLLKRVDNALYKAKKSGRNKVKFK